MVSILKTSEFGRRIAKVIKGCFSDVPFARVGAARTVTRNTAESGPDLIVTVKFPRGEKTLVVEARNSGQPRLARQAIMDLESYRKQYGKAYAVFAAPFISDRSAELCEKAGVGFIDLAGNCRLSFDQVYIRRAGLPNPLAEKRELRSLYSPKAARVLRVWLSKPNLPWKVQPLADQAGVSLGHVSNVKKLLADREWVVSNKAGSLLAQPEALLAEWAVNQRNYRDRIWRCYTLEKTPDFEFRLAKVCSRLGLQFALTGFSAASRFAPMVRQWHAMAYVANGVLSVIDELQLKPVDSGANVTLIEPGDEGVFLGAAPMDGICVVSPVQAYLDLMRIGGRGEEAAEALLQEVLRKRW